MHHQPRPRSRNGQIGILFSRLNYPSAPTNNRQPGLKHSDKGLCGVVEPPDWPMWQRGSSSLRPKRGRPHRKVGGRTSPLKQQISAKRHKSHLKCPRGERRGRWQSPRPYSCCSASRNRRLHSPPPFPANPVPPAKAARPARQNHDSAPTLGSTRSTGASAGDSRESVPRQFWRARGGGLSLTLRNHSCPGCTYSNPDSCCWLVVFRGARYFSGPN